MVLTKQLSIFIEMLRYATEIIYWVGYAFGRVEGIFLVETRGYARPPAGCYKKVGDLLCLASWPSVSISLSTGKFLRNLLPLSYASFSD